MKGKKNKKIVFVCTGNTCRSPMAEALLKRELISRGLQGIDVCSAGVAATTGDTINPKAALTLEEQRLSLENFSSAKVSEKLLKDAYAIVCMTEKQREYLMDARWNAFRKSGKEITENNVYSFAELTGYEVLDPYGKDMDCYRYVFGLLEAGMSALIEKLHLLEISEKAKKSQERKVAKEAKENAPKKRGRPKKTGTTSSAPKKRGSLTRAEPQ